MTDFEILALEYAESVVAYHAADMEYNRVGRGCVLAFRVGQAYERMCELQNQLNAAAAYVAASEA